ncbi:hypothetical protein HBI08_240030 [Parastagonospora nodorum]|nr:hypothetical protein HBI08_240030 [Parastagonospora nodorum]
MEFKLPIHDFSRKSHDPNDVPCQQVYSSGARAQVQEPNAHSSDTQACEHPSVSASCAAVAVQGDLHDCESDSDSDSDFVSSADSSDSDSDTDEDTDSDEDEHSCDESDGAGSPGSGEREMLFHHFPAAAGASSA